MRVGGAKITTILFLLAFVITPPALLNAQEVALSGTVTDSTDAVLPGATVTALHVDSGNNFIVVTDELGRFRIPAMRTGNYNVTVELSGFATVTRQGIEMLVGQRPVMNFKLTVSSLKEAITVIAESPLVETTQSKLGGNIDPRQLSELPVNGRNWMDLTMLAPGSRANDVRESPFGTHAGAVPAECRRPAGEQHDGLRALGPAEIQP